MGRYFVAVRPPASVLSILDGVPRPEADGVRWTPRDQLHVTIAFLGDVDEDDVTEALGRLDPPAATARLGPEVRTLGDQVIVVPVAGVDAQARIVREAIGPLAPDMVRRRFRGHLTLGRARRGLPDGVVGHRISSDFVVSELELISTRLGPTGAAHTVVGRFPVGSS